MDWYVRRTFLCRCRYFIAILLLLLLVLVSPTSHARQCQAETLPSKNLASLSLEELMQIEITSLSKKPELLSEAAAAIYVISREDIRRSGVTNIADALQMAPGMHVAQLNSHAWAVSPRGFNGFFANKLLVLVDGRSTYSSTFGGVYWDQINTSLENIERIEVIRGPAGSVWGANAVNGVINIITRCAVDTQGSGASLTFGKEDESILSFQHGGKLGKNGHIRGYIKTHQHDGFQNNGPMQDSWDSVQAGFRGDFNWGTDYNLMITGDIYQQSDDAFSPLTLSSVEEDVDTSNLNVRWEVKTDSGSSITLQSFVESSQRKSSLADISVDTFDIDFQHRFDWGSNNEFSWGLGYRHISDDIKDQVSVKFIPAKDDFNLNTAFVQNESRFLNDRLHLVIGSKFEHNDFTGSEIQPSIRGTWHTSDNFHLWAAASKAVHTPSRAFTSVSSIFVNTPFLSVTAQGNPNSDAEEAEVLELGIRGNIGKDFTWDATLFHAKYDDLVDSTTTITPTPIVFFPIQTVIAGSNNAEATTNGLELSGIWQVNEDIRLNATYSYLDIDAESQTDANYVINTEERSPRHQWSLRPSFDLSEDIKLDFWLKYVDDTEYTDSSSGTTVIRDIDDYYVLDARLAWQLGRNTELSLVGQDLLDSEHSEFGPEGSNTHATSVERNFYLQLRWQLH